MTNLESNLNLQVTVFLVVLVQAWVWIFKMIMWVWNFIIKCLHKFKFSKDNFRYVSKRFLSWTRILKSFSHKLKLTNKNKLNLITYKSKPNYNSNKCRKLSYKNFPKIERNILWIKNCNNLIWKQKICTKFTKIWIPISKAWMPSLHELSMVQSLRKRKCLKRSLVLLKRRLMKSVINYLLRIFKIL